MREGGGCVVIRSSTTNDKRRTGGCTPHMREGGASVILLVDDRRRTCTRSLGSVTRPRPSLLPPARTVQHTRSRGHVARHPGPALQAARKATRSTKQAGGNRGGTQRARGGRDELKKEPVPKWKESQRNEFGTRCIHAMGQCYPGDVFRLEFGAGGSVGMSPRSHAPVIAKFPQHRYDNMTTIHSI